MKFSPAFSFGTGTGEDDLRPIGVTVIEDNTLETVNTLQDIVSMGSGEVTSYGRVVNLDILPGFFYVGDRECYLFNEKLSQVSRVTLSGGIYSIKLKAIPDGPLRAGYASAFSDEEEEIELMSRGSSPIFVHRFASGQLTSLGVPLNQLISSETGLSGIMGYTRTSQPSGQIVSGDVANYPWYFSPITPYAKGYEYWRSSKTLPYDRYEHDVRSNSIYLSGDVASLSDEYLIEYEGRNEPLLVPCDLSPMYRIPEGGIVCMTPSGVPSGEAPYRINTYLEKDILAGEVTTVGVEVVSELGNPLQGIPVRAFLRRKDFMITSGEVVYSGVVMLSGVMISGEVVDEVRHILSIPVISGCNQLRDATHIYDEIVVPPGELSYGDVVTAGAARLSGNRVLIPSIGYLSEPYASGDPYNLNRTPYLMGYFPLQGGYTFSGLTDSDGMVRIPYVVPPVFGPGGTVELVLTANEINRIEEIVLSERRDDYYYGCSNNRYDTYLCISGTLRRVPSRNLIPVEWRDPANWMLVSGSVNAGIFWDPGEQALRFIGGGTWVLGSGTFSNPPASSLIPMTTSKFWYYRAVLRKQSGDSPLSFGDVAYDSSRVYQATMQHPGPYEPIGNSGTVPSPAWSEYCNNAIGGLQRTGTSATQADMTKFHSSPAVGYIRPFITVGVPGWQNSIVLLREFEIYSEDITFTVPIPDDCMSPVNLGVRSMSGALGEMYGRLMSGGSPYTGMSFTYPSDVVMASGEMYATYPDFTSGQMLMCTYPTTRSILQMNGRGNYGKFGL